MVISYPMTKLRNALNNLGIDYTTDDFEDSRDPDLIFHYEHTVWNRKDVGKTSVVYIYDENKYGNRYYGHYGTSEEIECWEIFDIGEPVAMTVDQVIKIADEAGKRK